MSEEKKQKKSSIDSAVQAALNSIAISRSRIVAFHYAVKGLGNSQWRMNEPHIQKAVSALNGVLYEELNEAYRRLFMWGIFDEKARKEAIDAAAEHFLKERMSIIELLFDDVRFRPERWETETEKRFRDEIAALIKRDSL